MDKNKVIEYYAKYGFCVKNHFPNQKGYEGIGWVSSNIKVKHDEPTHINIILGEDEIELFINYFGFDINEIWGKKSIKHGLGNQNYSVFFIYGENLFKEINEEIIKNLPSFKELING